MKKTLFFILFSFYVVIARSQDPAIIMNTSKSINSEITFYLYANLATTVQVDFGNGVKVDKLVSTTRTSITGTIVGSQTIKIYGSNIYCFDCISCGLTSLDVTKCTELVILSCSGNQLYPKIDLSNNTKLKYLTCSNNKLLELNVSNNIELIELSCSDNYISSIYTRKNTMLTLLDCSYNMISSLELTYNTALKQLKCEFNNISELDISKNTALTYLYCSSNEIPSLDISNNTLLNFLGCQNNRLTFATLPTQTINNFIYSPQKNIPCTSNLPVGNTFDLSVQYSILGNTTTYLWKTKAGDVLQEGIDYAINQGKTIFMKGIKDSVYCQLSNAYFPYITLQTSYIKVSRYQTITFNSLPQKNENDAPFDLNATASSNLPITYTSSDPSVASINGATVTILKSGTTTITATQIGNDTLFSAKTTQILTITPATAINKSEKDVDITISPNPASNMLYINGLYSIKPEATIYTISGTQVWKGKVHNGINISGLRAGVYFIQCIDKDNRNVLLKFIKQ